MASVLRGLALAIALTALAACSKSSSKSETKPTETGPTPKAKPTAKPRGWKAYSGKTNSQTGNLGSAATATVKGMDGKDVNLADAWKDSDVLVVFYRGHW